MNFSQQRKQIESGSRKKASTHDYLKEYFSVNHHDRLRDLEGRFIYHLYGDLIEREVEKDLKTFLDSQYRNADEYAKECVETVFSAKHLFGTKIKGWTDSALKCFDNLLLVLIQDHFNEMINKNTSVGREREKYWHLIEKGEGFTRIGTAFDTIYQQRSELSHVEIIERDGRRMQKRFSRKKLDRVKAIVLDNFNQALTNLEKEIPA